MRKQQGFSLIELVIAMAIVLVIAAIAVPNLLRAHIVANESSAAAGTRTMITAEMQYQASYPAVGFAPNLASLSGTSCASPTSASACLIDPALAAATTPANAKDGYIYGVAGTESGFSVGAYPATVGATGNQSFCAREDGVIRVDVTGANNNGTCPSGLFPQGLTH